MTREKKLDWLYRLKSKIYVYMPKEWLIPMNNALDIAIKALEQTRWTPVSERLPEENGQYLITVKYKHVNDSYEDVYAEHGEWSDGRWDMSCFGHCGEVEDIIAWMPLPEPYRAGIEE